VTLMSRKHRGNASRERRRGGLRLLPVDLNGSAGREGPAGHQAQQQPLGLGERNRVSVVVGVHLTVVHHIAGAFPLTSWIQGVFTCVSDPVENHQHHPFTVCGPADDAARIAFEEGGQFPGLHACVDGVQDRTWAEPLGRVIQPPPLPNHADTIPSGSRRFRGGWTGPAPRRNGSGPRTSDSRVTGARYDAERGSPIVGS
jgi:hypothetical protein